MKDHAAWIVGSAILAFAAEGWTGTIGDIVASSYGVPKSLLGIIGAALLGWLYNWLTANPSKPHRASKRPPKSH